jgi:hypothetical protein
VDLREGLLERKGGELIEERTTVNVPFRVLGVGVVTSMGGGCCQERRLGLGFHCWNTGYPHPRQRLVLPSFQLVAAAMGLTLTTEGVCYVGVQRDAGSPGLRC